MASPHIHVTGCSFRSGTTLLHELMINCFAVDRHFEHERGICRILPRRGEVLVSKQPRDARFAGQLLRRTSDLRILYMLRDPRDVICSTHKREPERYFSNIRLWREMHQAVQHVIGRPRFMLIRYEDLTREPDAVQRRILAFCPALRRKHAFSEYHLHARTSARSERAMNGVRPITPASVGRWREHLPRVKGQMLLHGSLTPDLIANGYETDDTWENCLAAVEADMRPSVRSERAPAWKSSTLRNCLNNYATASLYGFNRRLGRLLSRWTAAQTSAANV